MSELNCASVYIGDGVYAKFDSESQTVELWTVRHIGGRHWLILGPSEQSNLIAFLNSMVNKPPERHRSGLVVCPKCDGYVPGHATGSGDICTCDPITV